MAPKKQTSLPADAFSYVASPRVQWRWRLAGPGRQWQRPTAPRQAAASLSGSSNKIESSKWCCHFRLALQASRWWQPYGKEGAAAAHPSACWRWQLALTISLLRPLPSFQHSCNILCSAGCSFTRKQCLLAHGWLRALAAPAPSAHTSDSRAQGFASTVPPLPLAQRTLSITFPRLDPATEERESSGQQASAGAPNAS